MPLSIRSAADGDIPVLAQLWRACGLTRPWNDPESDISIARNWSGSDVLVAEVRGAVVASVMMGFDGHRGWIYYVAVRPDLQGHGYGRDIVKAAEDWLREQGCPKVELIIRADNTQVLNVYEKLGYKQEPRALMSKWLIEPPAQQQESGEPRLLDVTISYLEMTTAPTRPSLPPPSSREPLGLQRVHNPSVSYYRYLQHTVGDPWLWWERRAWDDAKLASVIQKDDIELYVLSVGGVPAGFVELDFREMNDAAEVAYFGLLPEFIGQGLGPYLLNWGIDCAWNRQPAPGVLKVNTCTLDHPSALGGYQKAGFEIVSRETKQVPDPVQAGHIPKSVRVLSPGY